MANKTSFFKPAVFLPMFFICLSLWAQSGRYVIEQRYVQRLSWVNDEYALRYEVVIERDEGGGYASYLSEFTELNRYQISLPLGNYRYCVIPYDLMDKPCEASDWVTLDVHPIPVVSVEVRPNDDKSYTLYPYDSDEIVPGIREITIKNPDVPEPDDKVIIAEIPEPQIIIQEKFVGDKREFFFEAAWAPVIPAYGEVYQLFGEQIYFSGAALRFGLLFTKQNSIRLGLETLISWYALNNVFYDQTINVQAGLIDLCFLMQLDISQRLALSLGLGGGFTLQTSDFYDEGELYMFDRIAPHLNIDASFIYFTTKRWFLELGINYLFFISSDDSSGYIRPWLGLGFKF
jgi:hypothetical protein